jgi:hypothetical protein
MPEPHEQHAAAFLRDHPEHRGNVRWIEVGGRLELTISTDAIKPFTEWAIRTGRVSDPGKATYTAAAMVDAIDRQFGPTK